MSNSLIITKQPSGVFSLQLNGEDVVRSEQNRLTMVGNYCHFKTANGANVVKEQMLLFSEVTLITTITETFASIDQLWQRLIDVGFFGTLGSGGGGGGADKFTELTDTFPSYLGRDNQALIINESQQRIESVPFYNVQSFTQLADTPSTLLANKMITTNDSGTALVMSDLPSLPEPALASVGTFDYADLTTQTTPLSFFTNVPKKLTNDGLGATSKSFPPYGVTSLWNSIDNSCNFSQLSNGDDTGIRIDLTVTTTSSNQIVRGYLKLGVGTAFEYDLQFFSENIKTAGINHLTFFTKVYIGSDEIRNAPADFYLVSDGNGSVKVNGWYFSVTRRSINIVSVENASTTWGNITGALSDQSDLQAALNGKQNSITGEQNYLTKFGISGVVQSQIYDNGNFVTIGSNEDLGSKLNVKGTLRSLLESSDIGDTILNGIEGVSSGFQITKSAGNVLDYRFSTGSNIVALNILNSGNVLINKTADNGSKLQVNGTISADPAITSSEVVILGQLNSANNENVKLLGDQSIDGTKTFLQPIKISSGSLAAPSISFFNETSGDTGFNHNSDGVIDVISNGNLIQKIEVDKTTSLVPIIAKNNFQVSKVGGAGKIEIDGDQTLHRKYSLQNVVTGISNAGFEIRDETGGFTPMYINNDGKVTFNFASFAPTAAVGTNTTQIATTAFVLANGARPYKVYTALLTQTGTNTPIATVLENTLGGAVTWSRDGQGYYSANSSGLFTLNKTAVFVSVGVNFISNSNQTTSQRPLTQNKVEIWTKENGTNIDAALSQTSIEIRVYN